MMNAQPEPNTPEKISGFVLRNPHEAVYGEQVKLLYQQLPIAILAVLVGAPAYTFIIWDDSKPYPAIIWLGLMLLLSAIRFRYAQQYKHRPKDEIYPRRWENIFLLGVSASALLWGSTSLWLNGQSPVLQQMTQFYILIGLVGGSIASLSSRPWAFRLFLLLSLLPYIIRFIYLGTSMHLAIAGLLGLYIVLMLPISMRIYQVITESLQLRYKNLDLLQSHAEIDEHNKKANEALFEVMKKNKLKELELEKSEGFLRSVLITANDSILTTDDKGIILTANHAIERDFGYTEQELTGKSLSIIMADDMGHKHDQYMQQYFKSEKPTLIGRMLDVTGKRKDGSLFPLEITVSEARIGDKIFFTGIIRNITDRKEHEKMFQQMMRELAHAKLDLEHANSLLHDKNLELTELSEHDELTGLSNRRFLVNTFEREWSRLQRNQKPMAVIMLDIDFFKRFNDSYGHQAGDDCLKQIAKTLAGHIARPADCIARYGGEEFIAVLPETDLDGAYHLAEKMRQAVEHMQIQHAGSDTTNHVTISGGVACTMPTRENNSGTLIQHADEALYTAKSSGRNCIRKYQV